MYAQLLDTRDLSPSKGQDRLRLLFQDLYCLLEIYLVDDLADLVVRYLSKVPHRYSATSRLVPDETGAAVHVQVRDRVCVDEPDPPRLQHQ